MKALSHSHSCGHRRATLNLDPPRQVGGNLTTSKQLGLTDSLQSLSDGWVIKSASAHKQGVSPAETERLCSGYTV